MEQELIDSEELAKLLSCSKKWVQKHRNRIVGSVKIGSMWRFRVQEIRARIAAGRNIVSE